MPSRDIEFSDKWVGTADCDIDPGEPRQWHDSQGNPGTPGEEPSVEVHRVWLVLQDRKGNDVEVDVLPFLHGAGIVDEDEISQAIYENEFNH